MWLVGEADGCDFVCEVVCGDGIIPSSMSSSMWRGSLIMDLGVVCGWPGLLRKETWAGSEFMDWNLDVAVILVQFLV